MYKRKTKIKIGGKKPKNSQKKRYGKRKRK